MLQAHSHFETQFSCVSRFLFGFVCLGVGLFVLLLVPTLGSLSVALFPFPVAQKGHSCTWLLAVGAGSSRFPISDICLCSGTVSLLRPDAISQQSTNRPLPGHFYTFPSHQTGGAAPEPLLRGLQVSGHPFTLVFCKFSLPCVPPLGRNYWYFGLIFSPKLQNDWPPL